mmetsp:Transcript_2076/g.4901  ORF Transcript_2076/g.4901 Transcript_2076/m.4901 type:complete len:266 (+) Transcript_2076:101-898(+)
MNPNTSDTSHSSVSMNPKKSKIGRTIVHVRKGWQMIAETTSPKPTSSDREPCLLLISSDAVSGCTTFRFSFFTLSCSRAITCASDTGTGGVLDIKSLGVSTTERTGPLPSVPVARGTLCSHVLAQDEVRKRNVNGWTVSRACWTRVCSHTSTAGFSTKASWYAPGYIKYVAFVVAKCPEHKSTTIVQGNKTSLLPVFTKLWILRLKGRCIMSTDGLDWLANTTTTSGMHCVNQLCRTGLTNKPSRHKANTHANRVLVASPPKEAM